MLLNLFLTAKSLHIIAIISWMAGILYYYRLFIYHQERGENSTENHLLLTLMERRLYRFITVPAMMVSILTGASLVWFNPGYLHQAWFHVKVTCVVFLVCTTLYGNQISKKLEQKKFSEFTSRQLRILNEVPTLLMIIIVCMVIFRPGLN